MSSPFVKKNADLRVFRGLLAVCASHSPKIPDQRDLWILWNLADNDRDNTSRSAQPDSCFLADSSARVAKTDVSGLTEKCPPGGGASSQVFPDKSSAGTLLGSREKYMTEKNLASNHFLENSIL